MMHVCTACVRRFAGVLLILIGTYLYLLVGLYYEALRWWLEASGCFGVN